MSHFSFDFILKFTRLTKARPQGARASPAGGAVSLSQKSACFYDILCGFLFVCFVAHNLLEKRLQEQKCRTTFCPYSDSLTTSRIGFGPTTRSFFTVETPNWNMVRKLDGINFIGDFCSPRSYKSPDWFKQKKKFQFKELN